MKLQQALSIPNLPSLLSLEGLCICPYFPAPTTSQDSLLNLPDTPSQTWELLPKVSASTGKSFAPTILHFLRLPFISDIEYLCPGERSISQLSNVSPNLL